MIPVIIRGDTARGITLSPAPGSPPVLPALKAVLKKMPALLF